jgi:hypothetical protein
VVFAVWQLDDDGLINRAWIFSDRASAETQAGLL